MKPITEDEALATAEEIELESPRREFETVSSRGMTAEVRKFFPEFADCPVPIRLAYSLFGSTEDGKLRLDFEVVCRRRASIWAHAYQASLVDGRAYRASELWGFASMGRPVPASWRYEEVTSALKDVYKVWWSAGVDVFYSCGMSAAGCDSALPEAIEAGVDVALDAYFSGVPAEHIAPGAPAWFMDMRERGLLCYPRSSKRADTARVRAHK